MRPIATNPGQLVLRFHAGRVEIINADPVIQASREWVDGIRNYLPMTSDNPGRGYITIKGDNRSVTYTIGTYNEESDSYMLYWPD